MSGDTSGNLGGHANLCSPSPCNLRPLYPYSCSSFPPSSPLSNTRLSVCFLLYSSSPPPCTSPVTPSIRSCNPSPVSTTRDCYRSSSRGLGRGTGNSHDMSFLLATSASSDGGCGRAVDMVGVERGRKAYRSCKFS